MKKKILFTPVGSTDPISRFNFHDGSMLHIARHYVPDVICMYMSKEILDAQALDDSYRYCLGRLGERLGHPFEIQEIERPLLEQVQLFNPIFIDFKEILSNLAKRMGEEDELLLNISSGTPAMKSSMFILGTVLGIPCKCIQVDTPVRSMNSRKAEVAAEYSPDQLWELNQDNFYQPNDRNYNRTHEESLIPLKELIREIGE